MNGSPSHKPLYNISAPIGMSLPALKKRCVHVGVLFVGGGCCASVCSCSAASARQLCFNRRMQHYGAFHYPASALRRDSYEVV
jgi:hypothetical protein